MAYLALGLAVVTAISAIIYSTMIISGRVSREEQEDED